MEGAWDIAGFQESWSRKSEPWALKTQGQPLQVTPTSGHLRSAHRPKQVGRLTWAETGKKRLPGIGE